MRSVPRGTVCELQYMYGYACTTVENGVVSTRLESSKSFDIGASRLTLKLVRYFMRLLGSLFAVLAVVGSACAQSLPSQQSSTGLRHPDLAQQSAVYVKVQLEKTVKVSALKPGDVIEGKLAQDVYSGDRELFAAGSQVRLTVDKLGRRRRVPNDYWPWVIKAFTPRHENYPTFQSATVSLPDGREVPLRVSLIFINRETQVHAPLETKKGGHPAASSAGRALASPD